MLKKLMNAGEQNVFDQIKPIADRYGAEIYRKVRIADVVDIDSLTKSLRSYALMAHFDFVATDSEQTPHFAVEFDGPGHRTQHDPKKDRICIDEDLGLFRVNLPVSRSQAGRLTFLGYIVHLWFLGQKFKKMQINGDVPSDEPFMISGFLKPNAKHIFDSEFDLLGPARANINSFFRTRNSPFAELAHMKISELLLRGVDGEFIAFTSYPVGTEKVYGRSAITIKVPSMGALGEVDFARIEMGQFCTALAIRDLADQLALFHSDSRHIARRRDEVLDEIRAVRQNGFKVMLSLFSGSDNELAKFAS